MKERIVINGVVYVPLYEIDAELQIALEKLGLKFYEIKLADNGET